MAPTAPLSYKSQTGYYGLRVNPTFEQVIGTIRNPLRVPLPERRAKWYALSPYRALILDAEQKFQDYEHAVHDYRRSQAELPEAAARVRSSDAGDDDVWDRIHQHGERMDQHDTYETAFDLMNQEHQRETKESRREQLRMSHGPNHMHPVVEASHEELREAGVPHHMPAPRPQPQQRAWHTPPGVEVAYGQPQAQEFPDFRILNMGDPSSVTQGALTPAQNMTYERMREVVVQPTWSS